VLQSGTLRSYMAATCGVQVQLPAAFVHQGHFETSRRRDGERGRCSRWKQYVCGAWRRSAIILTARAEDENSGTPKNAESVQSAVRSWLSVGHELSSSWEGHKTVELFPVHVNILVLSRNGWRATYAVEALESAAERLAASRAVSFSAAALPGSSATDQLSRAALPVPLVNVSARRGHALKIFGRGKHPVAAFDPARDLELNELVLCLDRGVRESALRLLERKGQPHNARRVRLLGDVNARELQRSAANPRAARFHHLVDIPQLPNYARDSVTGGTDRVLDAIDHVAARAMQQLLEELSV